MINRTADDRRIKNIKVKHNQREISRRKEDLANIKSYYAVLGLSVGFFLFIAVISFIWGR